MSGNQHMGGARNKGKRKSPGKLATIPEGRVVRGIVSDDQVDVVRVVADPPPRSPKAQTVIVATAALDLTREGLSTSVAVPPEQGGDLVRSWVLVVGMGTSVGGALGAMWLAPAVHLAGAYMLGAMALAALSPLLFCLLATFLLCKRD